MGSLWLWVIFNLFVLLMLAVDLGVFHRGARVISLKEATVWSIAWVAVALVFNAGLLAWYPEAFPPAGAPAWESLPRSIKATAEPAAALHSLRWMRATEFFFGYLIERALSIDNIFVFLVVFNYFRVEPRYQYRVLYWGILGALLMRGAMIAVGVALIRQFEWLLYVFGAFLLWTGWKLLTHQGATVHPEHNPVLKWVRKYVPVTKDYEGQNFFVRRRRIWQATPLFLVLVVVETTDLAFALDSIPAIFGVTQDAFIIYSSNVFAILGLRAMYFLLAGAMPYFRYLNHGLALVLMFIGGKMLIEHWVHIPILLALGVVALVLTVTIVASLVTAKKAAG